MEEKRHTKRRQSRENAFLAEFELSFQQTDLTELQETLQESENYQLDAFALQLLSLYEEHAAEVEARISENLKGWSSERLTKTSVSLLRLAIAEMLYGEPGTDSIIINEAVELSKKYAGDKEYQFVNGILGTISREKSAAQSAADQA